jgi:two-component system chemotaxis response regulator CheY
MNNNMSDVSSLSYLIVDDVSSVREFLRQTLISMQVSEIHESSNGTDAIEAFKKNIPDVVFLDIELPDLDGQSVLRQIKNIKSNAFVVMVSAHSTVENVKEAISNGAAGFIVKPFSQKKITTVLKKFSE